MSKRVRVIVRESYTFGERGDVVDEKTDGRFLVRLDNKRKYARHYFYFEEELKVI